MERNTSAGSAESVDGHSSLINTMQGSSLDHALLESLFYNEMILLQDPEGATAATESVPSPAFGPEQSPPCSNVPIDPVNDAHTLAEQALLNDFAVDDTGSATMTASVDEGPAALSAAFQQQVQLGHPPAPAVGACVTENAGNPQNMVVTYQAQPQADQPLLQGRFYQPNPALAAPVQPLAPNVSATNASSVAVNIINTVSAPEQAQNDPVALAAAAAAAGGAGPVQYQAIAPRPAPGVAPTAVAYQQSQYPNYAQQLQTTVYQTHQPGASLAPTAIAPQQVLVAPTTTALSNFASQSAPPAPYQVAQVPSAATAVAPPGINLVAVNAPAHLSIAAHPQPIPSPTSSSIASLPPIAPAPTVQQQEQLVSQFATLASRLGIDLPQSVLQSLTTKAAAIATPPSRHAKQVVEISKAADEAVSAAITKQPPPISRKRSNDEKDSMSDSNNAMDTSSSSVPKAPLYSKRRKKPRLSDCETRLAQLRSENALLQRHLQNVSSKAQLLDREKTQASAHLHQLLQNNATPEQLDQAVKNFTDLYSDYGRRRQQELTFHLEQLQRLVNPTSFTKMGLWTLGGSNDEKSSSPKPSDPASPPPVSKPKRKSNPIASILQKELDISPQQGRKILDQRDKIRVLCDNLNECMSLLSKLRALCATKTRLFHDRMNKCREILTTHQVVRLMLWIHSNTQILDRVCPGWGTEHMHHGNGNGAESSVPSSK